MLFIHSNNTKISSHGLMTNRQSILELPKASHQQHNMLFNIAITYQRTSNTYNPRLVSGLSKTTLEISPLSPSFWCRMNSHSGPRTSLTTKKALSQRMNQVGENPYLPEFFETPQHRYPHVALAVGFNFASCLVRI